MDAERRKEFREQNAKITQLPPINGRPVGHRAQPPISMGRNLEARTTVESDMEGQIEFWRTDIHVTGEWTVAETAIEYAVAVRLAVLEIIESDTPHDVRAIVEEVVRETLTPGASDPIIRFLRAQAASWSGIDEVRAGFADKMLDDYRKLLDA